MPKSIATTFECDNETLVGIFEEADSGSSRAVVMVVGGPQYRVGSHRQFALLARELAAAGVTTLRFDHRGIGDSSGDTTFEELDSDIRAAIDHCFERYPQRTDIVLWGLCDAASAILMYAPGDPRVSGVAILNPWVRSEQTLARSYLSGYYAKRLLQGDFWRQLFSGNVAIFQSIGDFFRNLRLARSASASGAVGSTAGGAAAPANTAFQERMMDGLKTFAGQALLILSGNDLTAGEFRIFVEGKRSYRRMLRRENVRVVEFPAADHTFSSASWRNQVSTWTREWLESW
jgi:exosortase A-associated hydrolase 1